MEPRVAKLEAAMEFVQRDIAELKADVRVIRSDITAIRTTAFRLLPALHAVLRALKLIP